MQFLFNLNNALRRFKDNRTSVSAGNTACKTKWPPLPDFHNQVMVMHGKQKKDDHYSHPRVSW